jgi:serine-type D-Ala-D-Ala carboxypeptidase/endopeptidase (penicillin-binding protein 4)
LNYFGFIFQGKKMTFNLNSLKLSVLVVIIIFGVNALSFAQRERVIEKPTPTPKVPKTATPTPSPSPTATPIPIQTLPSLQSKIIGVLRRPELHRGNVGIKVVSLDTGKTLYEENAEKYFMPASNMKVFTVATAMQKLSPNFKFVTSVYANALPDENGVIKGELTVYGRGDMTFSPAFADGDYYKNLDLLVEKIVQSGVKKIEGNLVGDQSYFHGYSVPEGWEWDDLQWYYGAGISSLTLNDNAVDLRVLPGASGASCIPQMTPSNTTIRIINTCTTGGDKRNLRVTKRLEQDLIEISGTIPAGDDGFSGRIAVSNSGELFISVLRQRLEQKGVVITGLNRSITVPEAITKNRIEITKLESTPLSIISQKTMKPSQNFYTETLLWTLGEEFGDKTDASKASADKGLAVVKSMLQEIGVSPDGVVQYDGSGLSRHNLVTPNSVIQVFRYMAKSPYALAWNASLTIGSLDGTLKNRFVGTSASANVRGKTGTIDQVSSLSGYVNSASGEKFVFSIIVNGVQQTSIRTKAIDEIVVALSDFNGRSEQPLTAPPPTN